MGRWIKQRKFGFGIFVYLAIAVSAMLAFAAYTGNKAVTVGGRATYDIYDEDTMVSDDAYGVATQQSIKSYVDNTSGLTPILVSGTTSFSAHTGSGTSFLQLRGGNFYLIDSSAINTDAMNKGDNDGIAASGITFFWPSAETDPAEVVGIAILTGTTKVNVRGAPNVDGGEAISGTTGSVYENFGAFTTGTSTVAVQTAVWAYLSHAGENAHWQATYEDCAVSGFITNFLLTQSSSL